MSDRKTYIYILHYKKRRYPTINIIIGSEEWSRCQIMWIGIKHNYTLLKPLLMVILKKEIKNVINLRTLTVYHILMFYIFYNKIISSIDKDILIIIRVGCRCSIINS